MFDQSHTSPRLTPGQIDALLPWGRVETLVDGQIAFTEGETDYNCCVVLEGALRVTRQIGGEEQLLAVHAAGEFSGEISLMTRQKSPATGRAVGRTRVLIIRPENLRRLIAETTPVANLILSAMTARTRDVEAEIRQQEKMAALGKMSAGLAHELNNPASAAQRSARDLVEAVKIFAREGLAHDNRLGPQQRQAIFEFVVEVVKGRKQGCILAPLERSDREAAVTDQLTGWGLSEPWELTSVLVDAGVTDARLAQLAADVDHGSLSTVLHWMESALRMIDLAINIEQSTQRVSDLVSAMKRYSRMDQASLAVTNVNETLETTLAIFGHRLRGRVQVDRRYDVHLPTICAYGGELNQVWTNLIDNALDAMQGEGTLRLRTSVEDDFILVEIGDTGPGIPEDVQPRIFEPFFTTKPAGQGTGLGLDISYRIIVQRHQGSIKVLSRPGDTRFQVRLPLRGAEPPDALPAECQRLANPSRVV